MILITGTQRAGTTVLLEFLSRCGYKTGNEMDWDKGVFGGRENLNIANFIGDYIGDESFPFTEFPEAEPRLKNLNIELAKSSYLLMNPVFLNIYYKFRGNRDKLIVMNRDKDAVIESKRNYWKQFKKDSLLLKQGGSYLQHNFLKSLELLDKYEFEYTIVNFPYFTESFDYLQQKLAKLDIDISDNEELFYELIDRDKIGK